MRKAGFVEIKPLNLPDKQNTNDELIYILHIFTETKNGYELIKSVDTPTTSDFQELDFYYLSLPIKLFNFRLLEFPFKEKDKLKKVIPYELDRYTLGGSKELVYDHLLLKEKEKNLYEILVAYIDKKILTKIIKKISDIAELKPLSVTSLELTHFFNKHKDALAFALLNIEESTSEDNKTMLSNAIETLQKYPLNFYPEEVAYLQKTTKETKKINLLLTLLLLFFLSININLGFKIFIKNAEVSNLKNQIRTIYTSTFPEDKKISDELYQIKSHMKNISEKANILVGTNVLEHLRKLSNKEKKGIVVEELNIEKEMITIKGVANSISELDDLKKSLSNFYREISLSDIKTINENKVLFTITIKE
ncbi:MAG: hypothetical protein N3A59_03445 [Thermodesulfovibrionales bacterium]|nr:hypothetical protein [Thermodesulfovibrionales bacterium]